MQENEDAGMDRDTALATAIDDVSTELGLAKEDLLTAIGTTEEALTTRSLKLVLRGWLRK
jgi:hypothetical protein